MRGPPQSRSAPSTARERIRTYNFPENRITDHRTGYKAYNLDTVLDGELDAVVQSAVDADEAARLAAVARTVGDVSGSPARRGPARRRPAGRGRRPSARRRRRALAAHALRRGRQRGPRRLMVLGGDDAPDGYGGARGRAGAAGCRCSTSPAARTSAGWSSRSARASSCRGPRPRCVVGPPIDAALAGGRRARSWSTSAPGRAPSRSPSTREVPGRDGARGRAVRPAHAWAVRNRDRLGLDVDLERGDATTAFPELAAPSTSSPATRRTSPTAPVPVDPEVRDHDPRGRALRRQRRRPGHARWRWPRRAAALLRAGGMLVMEHADDAGTRAAAAPWPARRLDRGHRPRRPAGPAARVVARRACARGRTCMSAVFDCTTPEGGAPGVEAAAAGRPVRPGRRAADRHRLRDRVRRVRRRGRDRRARRQGPRSRHAAAGPRPQPAPSTAWRGGRPTTPAT